MQEQKLQFDGRLSQLYKLWLVNFLLNIMTLGIFSFWGKTRVRRYVTSSMKLGEDRFEYTGTGGELFKSFILAMTFFVFLSIPLFVAMWYVSEFYEDNADTYERIQVIQQETEQLALGEKHDKLTKESDELTQKLLVDFVTHYTGSMITIGIYFILYFGILPPLARYSVLTYQVGHIRWRSIRGHQGGKAYLYPFLKGFHLFLTIITLSFWKPFGDAYLTKYKLNHMQFGSQMGEVKPRFFDLFTSHLLTLLLFPLTLGLSRFWYKASLARIHTRDFKFGDIEFDTEMTGWDLLKLRIGNLFLLIFTLGLGYPIVLKRNMTFMAKHTVIKGDLDKAMVEQAPGGTPQTGEGISHWIDVGARFGTGYLLVYF